jgi:predicted HAD superfamily Cof-like phosphohydrolase
MQDLFNMVREFNRTCGETLPETPFIRTDNVAELRYKLMQEENEEYYTAAIEDQDIVGVLDAVVDKMYILLGTIQVHGLEDVFQAAFAEVHRSNMTKFPGGKVLRREDGKIMKPETYEKPNLKRTLIEYYQ